MLREDQTCPKCGALVTPQLTRCRQCNHYLHGSQLEGLIIEAILPKSMSGSPGTSLITVYILVYYTLMVLLTGPQSIAGFHSLALLQLGLTTSTEIQDLELWRFVSSVFAHGNLLHIFFNLYALSIVGSLVEQLYDRKRVLVFFVLSGVISMFGSYAYQMFLLNKVFFMGSVGASGAVSGLLGLAWWNTRSLGSEGREAHSSITRWLVMLILWGFIPGVDGAAHLVGVAVGVMLAWLLPPGPLTRRWTHQVWTTMALLSMVLVIASTGLTLLEAKGYPYRLKNDQQPLQFLFITLEAGAPWRRSGQYVALRDCLEQFKDGQPPLKEALYNCELAVRAVPYAAGAHLALSALLERVGEKARAERQQHIGDYLRRH
ncbi:MAG: rhomboid family intramembrane serine protease [Myxococcales bacterium]|nr:rhomboid family intramembrane serine protease [Myxococcales bacterium]